MRLYFMFDKFAVINLDLIDPIRRILNMLQYVELPSNILFNSINVCAFYDKNLFYVGILNVQNNLALKFYFANSFQLVKN